HQRGAGARRRVEDVGGRVAAAADRDVGDDAVVVGDEQAVPGGGGVPQQARGRGVQARSAQQHAVEAGRASGPGGERGQRVGARVEGGGVVVGAVHLCPGVVQAQPGGEGGVAVVEVAHQDDVGAGDGQRLGEEGQLRCAACGPVDGVVAGQVGGGHRDRSVG